MENKTNDKSNDSKTPKSELTKLNEKDIKERNKKIRLLDKIDNMRVVQNNHFIIGKFEDSINVAKEIIKLAKDAKLNSIVEEQEQFIDQVKLKMVEKNKIKLILDAFKVVSNEYETLIKKEKIIQAHNLINDFKKKHERNYELTIIPQISEFLSKDREIWIEFMDEHDKKIKKLKTLSNNFQKSLKINDLTAVLEFLKEAEPLLKDLVDDEIKKQWESYEQKYKEKKENNELCDRVDKVIDESLKLKDQFIFEEALLKIDSIIEVIKSRELPQCKSKLSETREEIIASEIKYNKLYLELAKFKDEFRFNRENQFLHAMARVCEKIIDVSQLIGMNDAQKEFEQILKETKNQISEDEKSSRIELDKLKKDAKEIEKLIQINENVLPIVEEFSVKELLGTLSDGEKEKLEQLGTLLIENRADIKNEIINKVLLKTISEEVIESLIPREVLLLDDKGTLLSVRSGLTNRFDDAIEEAVIKDLIPYNYEVISIKKDGKIVKTLPEKIFRKDGMELIWQIKNLKSKERVDLSYTLRCRVSTTIIFVIGDVLKIIKTHENLQKIEGDDLYESILTFNNVYGKKLDGLIFEDIVPSYYAHLIEEPKDLLPIKTTGLDFGDLFRWDIGHINGDSLTFKYKLLEKNQFEGIRNEINDLSKIGFESLNKGNIIKALDKFKQIKNILVSKVK
ncbi:MAG: hypothetical protein ACFFAO_05335 [Candidatus Hermodarchaeota archaeon]